MENFKTMFEKSFGHKLAIICFALSFIAILPFPYAFYILTRVVFFVALIWCGWQLYQEDDKIRNIHFVIGGLAILYNPIFLVHLGSKLIWFVINICTAFLILKISNQLITDKSVNNEDSKKAEITPEIFTTKTSKATNPATEQSVSKSSKEAKDLRKKPSVKETENNEKMDVGLPVFKLTLGKTYFKQGFFNVGVDFERYVTKSDEKITIYVGPQKQSISGRSSRKYNTNGTPRILGGISLRDWFQKTFEVGDTVDVKFISPTKVWLT